MSLSLISIEVWRDCGSSAAVTVYREGHKVDRIQVIPGDCFDLELGPGMHAVLSETPAAEEQAEIFAAQDAVARAELEEAS